MLTPTQREKFLAEVLDPNRTVLYCGQHYYTATPGTTPTPGCRDCHMVFWMHEAAGMPAHERRERLERLQATVRHIAEDLERGTFDFEFNPTGHPEITEE